jgi:hypothetical protein
MPFPKILEFLKIFIFTILPAQLLQQFNLLQNIIVISWGKFFQYSMRSPSLFYIMPYYTVGDSKTSDCLDLFE